MRSNRGVTLTSLVFYVIGLTMVITLMSLATGYFYKNINHITMKQNSNEQYSKFLSYISNDVNSKRVAFVQSNKENKWLSIKLDNGEEHQYILKNEKIYFVSLDNSGNVKKKITLCSSVTATEPFKYNGSDSISINFKIKDKIFLKNLTVEI